MRKSELGDKIFLCLNALFLISGSIVLSFFPAPRFSPSENRNLADLPHFERAALASGAYTAALDTYATERFPYRRQMRGARALYLLGSGRFEVGDAVLCTDGSLSRKVAVNAHIWRKNMVGLRWWQAALGDKLTVAVAPCRIEARAEVLPPLFVGEDYEPYWAELDGTAKNLVTFQDFSCDTLWYRTDHHWTTAGAYLAYTRLGEQLGYKPLPADLFSRETVTDRFFGTTDAAAGIPFIKPDCIELYRFSGDTEKRVEINGKAAPFVGFYDFEKLQTRDGYGIFFGGNYADLSIKGNEGLPRLLVIKDSFANSLLPFLSNHFNITAVDPRYGTIKASSEDFDAVLVLCGMQTLSTLSFMK